MSMNSFFRRSITTTSWTDLSPSLSEINNLNKIEKDFFSSKIIFLVFCMHRNDQTVISKIHYRIILYIFSTLWANLKEIFIVVICT
jgi:hypothetical protein